MQNTAPQSVDGPDHQDIELSPYRVLEHRVEGGALIPAFRPSSMSDSLSSEPACIPPTHPARATKARPTRRCCGKQPRVA